jgi:hypothetical protein
MNITPLFAPDGRRWIRTVVQAVMVFTLLYLLSRIVDLLKTEDGLREIGRYMIYLLGIGTLGYQIENGVRSFDIHGPGGTSIEVDGGDGPQSVTATAQATVQS